VVITIILLISAVALPTVLPALAHRQVSEAARILQGALVGARDNAIHNNAPSGIRLLLDPAFPIIAYLPNGQINPTQPLAANRIVPIDSAPEYTEGLVNPVTAQLLQNVGFTPPYPCLVVVESVVNNTTMPGVPNSPTSWFWNIRVGDKIQINAAGTWYTVVGPLTIGAVGNPELFVNVGAPGTQSPLKLLQGPGPTAVNPEYLFLVNGQDDNNNGWIDEGYDGVDNDGDGLVDETTCTLFPVYGEWEIEAWQGSLTTVGLVDLPYTIQRRPTPSTNAREVSLPSNVVVDLTSWGTSLERSRLPINAYTGYVDILVYPNGTVVPTTIYSTPSSFGLLGSFFHFWLAERSDVVAINFDAHGNPVPLVAGQPVFLPIGNIPQQIALPAPPAAVPRIQGEYRLVTLFTRTGQITTADDVQFDNPANPANGSLYNPNYPFLAAQQGSRGGP